MNKLIKVIKNPSLLLLYTMKYRPFRLLSDERFIKIEYFLKTGKKLNLNRPQTFNEKLQWLKLNDRNPKYTQLVDKYEVRNYIKKTIGEEYLIPLYGVYDSFEEINFSDLPEQFVLKPNHTSGNYFICRDKNSIDYRKLKKEIDSWLKRDYYWVHREWPYKNVKPRIIAEKYMEDSTEKELKDYKFFCFNGEPRLMFVASDRAEDTKFDFYDIEFNRLPLQQVYPNSKNHGKKPINFELMKELSSDLSRNIPHVRVDFYEVNGKVYFGELTFYHFSGNVPFNPEKYDWLLGSWINLSRQ